MVKQNYYWWHNDSLIVLYTVRRLGDLEYYPVSLTQWVSWELPESANSPPRVHWWEVNTQVFLYPRLDRINQLTRTPTNYKYGLVPWAVRLLIIALLWLTFSNVEIFVVRLLNKHTDWSIQTSGPLEVQTGHGRVKSHSLSPFQPPSQLHALHSVCDIWLLYRT